MKIKLALLLIFSVVMQEEILAQKADIILTNGKIFTSDTTHLYVQALAIKGNKITAIGADEKTKQRS